MLFASDSAPLALRYYPDGRGDLDEELRRYGMLRFGSAIGFKPPYFYHWPLVDRLYGRRCRRSSSGAPTITWCRSRTAERTPRVSAMPLH